MSERFLRLHARVTELLAQHVGQGESRSFGSRTHFAEQDRGAGAVGVVPIAENFYQDGHGCFGFATDLPQCVDRLQAEVVIIQEQRGFEFGKRGAGRRTDLGEGDHRGAPHCGDGIFQRLGQRGSGRAGCGAEVANV